MASTSRSRSRSRSERKSKRRSRSRSRSPRRRSRSRDRKPVDARRDEPDAGEGVSLLCRNLGYNTDKEVVRNAFKEFGRVVVARQRHSLDQAQLPVDPCQTASRVLDRTRDDLETEDALALEVGAEEPRVCARAERVDVVKEERANLGPLFEEIGKRAGEERVG